MKEIADLFLKFDALRERRAKGSLIKAREFFELYDEKQKGFVATGRSEFNTFSILRFGGDEVRHTQILAWLLNERGSHGQGDLFFRAFLDAAGLLYTEGQRKHYRVRAEFLGREAKTDIVIYCAPNFAIAVENKIFANQGEDQLDREFRDLERHALSENIPTENIRGVFITRDGRDPHTRKPDTWIPLSHFKLVESFEATISEIRDEKLRCLLLDLFETSKSWS